MLTGTAACASDAALSPSISESSATNAIFAPTIVVASSSELIAALTPANAGRRILVRAGSYAVSQLLTVPDDATIEGEGVMEYDEGGLPTGFEMGTRTTISMVANVPGIVLSLGNGSALRNVAIEDLPGRAGSAVGVSSRDAGDHVSALINEVEIVSRTPHNVGPQGPIGCSIAVTSQNLNLGNAPPPHADAVVSARITRSLLRSPALGIGCGVFAFNFAQLANVNVSLADNVVGGGIIAAGGVSRGNSVYDAKTVITSHRNLYREDTGSPCTARRTGWNLQGGSGSPVLVSALATERNTLVIHSRDDRLEGFTTAILGSGGRQFFASAAGGPSSDNVLDLQLLGTTITTASCAGVASVDFRLAGALVSNGAIVPGDGNTLRALFRGVTASGVRANVYADVLGPTGPQPAALAGSGNMLLFVGNTNAFAQTNRAIDPAPSAHFFSGAH